MKKLLFILVLLAFGPLQEPGCAQDTIGGQKFMEGDFWRDQVLIDLMPNWYTYGWDKEQGAFYLNLSREWESMPPYVIKEICRFEYYAYDRFH